MPTTTEIGNYWEQKAAYFLKEQGVELLERNYRFKKAEVDIIGKKDGLLFFFEVKYRKGNFFGHPEESVDDKKMDLLKMAAEEYTEKINWTKDIQFDIIAITGNKNAYKILRIEDID